MAKRFTDTDKWKKPFIRTMKAPYKLLWLYILDECDHAGIWQVDFTVAQIKIGEKLKENEAIKSFAGKIHVFDDGHKWFIFDFIDFQYGVLDPINRVHNSILTKLSKYGIDYQNKPLISPLQGAKDKDMDKDMDKDNGGAGGKIVSLKADEVGPTVYRKFKHLQITSDQVDQLLAEGYSILEINNILDAIENYRKNTHYTSLFLTAKKWLGRERKQSGGKMAGILTVDQQQEEEIKRKHGIK